MIMNKEILGCRVLRYSDVVCDYREIFWYSFGVIELFNIDGEFC